MFSMTKVPQAINQSFVDDITLMTPSKDLLQSAFDVVDPFLELTDQKLNVKKTNTFGINTGSFCVWYRGERVAAKETLKHSRSQAPVRQRECLLRFHARGFVFPGVCLF